MVNLIVQGEPFSQLKIQMVPPGIRIEGDMLYHRTYNTCFQSPGIEALGVANPSMGPMVPDSAAGRIWTWEGVPPANQYGGHYLLTV